MVSTADFACVSIDGKTALVYASVTKEGKDDVQCMVQSTASTDCFFQADLASCDAYKKSQPTLAIHCITSSPFCAKVPFVLKNTPSPTPNPNAVPTSALCMRNNTRWTCFADPDSKLVVLVGVVNGTFNCISADTSGTICNVYPSQQACTAQCPSIVERPTLGMKACESSSTGTVSCIAATPTSAAASSMSKAPAAESSNAADSSLSSADDAVSPVTVTLLVVVVGLVLFSLLFLCRKRRYPANLRRSSSDSTASVVWLDQKTASTDFVGIKLDMGDLHLWRLDESQLVSLEVLATGAHGVVSLAKYKNQRVAIKKQLASERTAANVQLFIDEVKLMARLESPFIVQFIGVSWLRPREIELVVEYMDYGDLRQHLETTTPDSFDWTDKLQIATDVVDGLLYLHSMDIIHRDLKARNVLLNHHLRAKLTDFGIARDVTLDTMTQGVGTCRWTAPEVLEGNHYTVAADVYSFGMVLVELDTHKVPYMHMNEVSNFVLMERLREASLKPDVSATCPPSVALLIQRCVTWQPQERPSALEISTTLRALRRQGGLS
ncbi:TKL protein kinase [Aphanomyces astaci]|uniref:TKL protein kinase n=1 Tax=Aphanomyces astaci TaxID=112090 RepID=W4FQA3_APHAT|nr:TKL protein kinase [Aphanomyces astaci]ETV68999.1 TKL protein kinase [Aphanomyces astaci]|eukprot:XP_009841458.1 TKL protein kinase [Aphanomyces astaci]